MRVLLIQPPVEDFYTTAVRTYPLGLACLATVLETAGHTVAILDAHRPRQCAPRPLPAEFGHLHRYYPPAAAAPYKLFRQYRRFGLSTEEIRVSIRQYDPAVVGVAAMFSAYADQALECARVVKELDMNIPVVMGGAHATVAPEHLLADPAVDWVIMGEGERPLAALMAYFTTGAPRPEQITGLGWKAPGGLRLQPELDLIQDGARLPTPARHLLDPTDYTIAGRRYTALQTSRGCPHRCGFCTVHCLSGTGVRRRPTADVVAEMQACVRRWDIRHFDLEDDHFPLNRQAALELAAAVRGCPELEGVEFTAMNGMPTRPLDQEVLAALRDMGFRHLDLAMVSASAATLDRLGRPDNPRHFYHVLDRAAALGLATVSYFIIGLPGELPPVTLTTLVRLMARPGILGGSVLYLTPGTELYRQWPHRLAYRQMRSTAAACARPDFTPDQQLTILMLVRLVNYLKSLLPPGTRRPFKELRDELQTRYALTDTWQGPFGVTAAMGDAGRVAAATSLATGRLLGLRRVSRRPHRFLLAEEPLDHGLFRDFLDTAVAFSIAAAQPAGANRPVPSHPTGAPGRIASSET
ncbi:MAG: B12-binding domain-containing radical SAM protein [Acidobacteria bacterium]|nr:B12-binding domain-containing radical SAM protein [Acidobacteriota bacterium]